MKKPDLIQWIDARLENNETIYVGILPALGNITDPSGKGRIPITWDKRDGKYMILVPNEEVAKQVANIVMNIKKMIELEEGQKATERRIEKARAKTFFKKEANY